MNIEALMSALSEQTQHRYYGKYRGEVVDNDDPEQRGRLKVCVPSLFTDQVVTGWALPCVPYGGAPNQGFLFVPDVGAAVWVEFEGGDPEFPIWCGTFWGKPGGTTDLPKPNDATGAEQSVQSPPTCKIIKTAKGHTIQLEDADGSEMIVVKEGEHNHVIALDADGIAVTDGANSHSLKMTSSGITVEDGVNSHKVVLDNAGISVTDGKNSHKITLSASDCAIKSAWGAEVTISPSGIKISSSAIVEVTGSLLKLNGGALPVVRITDFGVGNLGAPVVITSMGNPTVLA